MQKNIFLIKKKISPIAKVMHYPRLTLPSICALDLYPYLFDDVTLAILLTFFVSHQFFYWVISSSMQTMFLPSLQNLTLLSPLHLLPPISLFSFTIKCLKELIIFCPLPHLDSSVRLLSPPSHQDCSCCI